jgi:hypothetical protein
MTTRGRDRKAEADEPRAARGDATKEPPLRAKMYGHDQ